MKDTEFVPSMTKSDLIDNLSKNQGHLAYKGRRAGGKKFDRNDE